MSYRLTQKKKSLLVAIHVICIASWIGGTFGMLLLGLYLQKAANGEQLAYTLSSMEVIDEYLLKYPALLTLLTGVLLSIWTQWGLVKHYWVLIKLILTVVTILLGIFFLDNWTTSLADRVADLGYGSMDNPEYRRTWISTILMCAFNLICLLLMVFITYFKPFRKLNRRGGASKLPNRS